jgi:hypothetical protein
LSKSPKGRPPKPSWYRRALETVVVGAIFGFVVSLALNLFAAAPAVATLERWGTDAGQRLQELVTRNLAPHPEEGAVRFSFLNLTREACNLFVDDPWDCANPGAPPSELLAAAIDAVAASKPLVLIVDFPLDNAKLTDVAGRLKEIAAARTVPIVVPAQARPLSRYRHALALEPTTIAPEGLNVTRASFAVWTDEDVPGAVRGYPATTWVRKVDDDRLSLIPSAPFATVMLIDDPSSKTLSCVASATSIKECDLAGKASLLSKSLMASPSSALDVAARRYDQGRIRFTIPDWMSYDEDGALKTTAATEDRYDTILRVFDTTDLADSSPTPSLWLPPEQVAGTVVVIGSAASEAADLHATPLGVQQGWVVLINAIRAFYLFPPAEDDKGGPSLLVDLAIVGLTSAVLLAFELIRERARDALNRRRSRKPLAVATRVLVSVALFIGVLIATTAVSVFIQAIILFFAADGPGQFNETDFLIPTLAVLLGCWVEVAERVLHYLRSAVSMMTDYLRRGWARITRPVVPPGD